MTLLVLLGSVQGSWATDFITDVMVIGGTQREVNTLMDTYKGRGWKVIDQDLNKGCGSKSDYIYLLYKTASGDDANATFITDFYISTASGTPPEEIISNNRTYTLTPYDGGSHFESVHGDLNSNAGGADIHLYYTKDNYDDRAVKSITFNNTKSGAEGENGGTTSCDLNKGAGGDYIYMHTQYSEGWIITKNVTGDQCFINGYEGPVATITTITIPYYIDGAAVIGIRMNFSAFKNLETMNFYRSTLIDWMPSVKGCSKFKNINQLRSDGSLQVNNILPDAITYVQSSAFAGTAIETLDMPNVTGVGDNAFEGCNKLKSVNFGKAATIGIGAFSKINNKTTSGNQTTYNQTTITYPGLLSDWQWSSYEYSPNLVINCKDGSCGWCGDEYNVSTMYKDACLYWVLTYYALTIDCIPLDDFFERYGTSQVTKTHLWTAYKDKMSSLSMSHVYGFGDNAFKDCTKLTTVTINSNAFLSKTYSEDSSLKDIFGTQVGNYIIGNEVTGIGNYAFYCCYNLSSITIPNSVTGIGNNAFYGCNNLRTVTINSNAVLSKSYSANSALRDIFGIQVENYIIGNEVTGIGDYAFYGCNGLSSFTIPNNVTSVGNSAFIECNNLRTVTINSNAVLSKSYSANSALRDIFGTKVGNYIIGNEVTGIGDYAFYGCNNLATISIPNGMMRIGKDAFTNCNNLSDIYFDGTEARLEQVEKEDNWKPDATVVHWRCTVTFDANGHGTAPSAQTNLWSNESLVADPGAITATDYDFKGWYADAACTTPWNFNSDIVPGDMTLYACWIDKHDLLANTVNSQNLAGWNGTACTVQLKGSSICKDHCWNTLCLPFSLDNLNGTPLERLILMELDAANSHFSDGTLTLNFTKAENVEAGKPYLVKDDFLFPIATKADWDVFAARVNAGEKGLHAWLVADIIEPVTTMVDHYEGVFDGCGHTLTIAYGTEETPMTMRCAAPFVEIDKATIRNLNVKGDIYTSEIHGGGLAGRMIDNCHVEYCNVGVTIHSAVVGAGKHGGYVGCVDGVYNVINDCAFTGSLLGPSTTHCGGFIGKNEGKKVTVEEDGGNNLLPTPIRLNHCYLNPSSVTIGALESYTFSQYQIYIYDTGDAQEEFTNVEITNCFYTRAFGEEQGAATSATGSDLVALLGDAWELRDGQVMLKIMESYIVNPIFRNVTIDATAPTGVYTADNTACFIGSYDPVIITGADRATLFLNDNNKLYFPDGTISLNAFKGRFLLANALTDPSKGDVNGDEVLSVTDVAFLVGHILGTDDDNFVIANADVNGDGEISVNDVSALVSLILGGSNKVFNVVTNLNGIPITFEGGGSGAIR